jgi:hypothetical protein
MGCKVKRKQCCTDYVCYLSTLNFINFPGQFGTLPTLLTGSPCSVCNTQIEYAYIALTNTTKQGTSFQISASIYEVYVYRDSTCTGSFSIKPKPYWMHLLTWRRYVKAFEISAKIICFVFYARVTVTLLIMLEKTGDIFCAAEWHLHRKREC